MSFVSNSIENKSSSCQAIDEFQDPDFPFHMTPSRATTRTAPRWSWRLSVSLSVITLKHPAILCQTALVSLFSIGSELPSLEKILSRLSDYGVSSANCSCAVEPDEDPIGLLTLILLFPLTLFIFPFLELTRSTCWSDHKENPACKGEGFSRMHTRGNSVITGSSELGMSAVCAAVNDTASSCSPSFRALLCRLQSSTASRRRASSPLLNASLWVWLKSSGARRLTTCIICHCIHNPSLVDLLICGMSDDQERPEDSFLTRVLIEQPIQYVRKFIASRRLEGIEGLEYFLRDFLYDDCFSSSHAKMLGRLSIRYRDRSGNCGNELWTL